MLAAYAVALAMILFGPLTAFYFIWVAIGLNKFSSVFALPYGGPLDRIDPRVKLIMAIALPAVSDVVSPAYVLLLLAIILMLYTFTPRSKDKYAFIFPLIAATVIPAAWTASIEFRPRMGYGYELLLPSSLRALGVSGFSALGFQFGLLSGLRDSVAVASAFFIVFSSSPADLLRALAKSKVPVEIGFILTVALTAIPRIIDQVSATIEAMRSRGFSWRQWSARRPLSIPRVVFAGLLGIANVVILSIMSAQSLAISADLRGFRSGKNRSYYKDVSLTPLDGILIALLVSVWAISLVIK
ncbi:energy-coupling factor transporter transmembrane component T [Tardisphaera miroshnichenkoae]